jgi:hypothetical protein
MRSPCTKVPSKGRWLGADDPEVAEDQQRYDREAAEQARRDELSELRLSDLMKHFNGNLAAALEAKMLTDGEPVDQLEVIADGMMRGNLDDRDFALLRQLPKLRRIYLREICITDSGLSIAAFQTIIAGPYAGNRRRSCQHPSSRMAARLDD